MKEDAEHIPIERKMIRDNAIQSFDVFFRSPEGKMVLYCAGGKHVEQNVLDKIHESKIEFLYINRRDQHGYRQYVETHLPGILADNDIPTPKRAQVAYQSIVYIADQLFKQPRGEALQRYRSVILTMLDFVFRDNVALQNLIGMTTLDFSIYNHSINVGVFSIGLTKEILGNTSEYNLGEAIIGFFLHDIGKCRIPRDILHKRGPLTRAEWKCVQSHVEEGLRILAEHDLLYPETRIIVSQHHERHDGSGYPHNLRGDNIHMLARICSIADMFDGLTSYRPFKKEHSSFEALRIMKNEMFRHFDPDIFQKFVRLFGKG